jgi:hypothetical protein
MDNSPRCAPFTFLNMNNTNAQTAWEAYCKEELALLTPILNSHQITLDLEQKHMGGERFLQQAITTTGGRKLILTGERRGIRVVIKASRDLDGKREIEHERTCKQVLARINFATSTFHTPKEILFVHDQGFAISVQEFIPQETQFIELDLKTQFVYALDAFKAQEGTHATTAKHRALIKRTYGMRDAHTYLHTFQTFSANVAFALPEDMRLKKLYNEAYTLLRENERTIEQYTGFLTHTDFVPHNIRTHENVMFLLDHSSLTFGNKYEGWARFLNFMTLYNPPLTELLTQYVKDNRTPEESVSLRMMRIYRLGEIIWYYVRTLDKSVGNLRTLNEARVTFWSTVLAHILDNTPIPTNVIEDYKNTRDSLRSEDEKKRQQGLH